MLERRKKQLTTKEPYRKLSDNSWLITVQENGKDKDLYIELPPDALNQAGWVEDDIIEWVDNNDGSWTLKKKEADET